MEFKFRQNPLGTPLHDMGLMSPSTLCCIGSDGVGDGGGAIGGASGSDPQELIHRMHQDLQTLRDGLRQYDEASSVVEERSAAAESVQEKLMARIGKLERELASVREELEDAQTRPRSDDALNDSFIASLLWGKDVDGLPWITAESIDAIPIAAEQALRAMRAGVGRCYGERSPQILPCLLTALGALGSSGVVGATTVVSNVLGSLIYPELEDRRGRGMVSQAVRLASLLREGAGRIDRMESRLHTGFTFLGWEYNPRTRRMKRAERTYPVVVDAVVDRTMIEIKATPLSGYEGRLLRQLLTRSDRRSSVFELRGEISGDDAAVRTVQRFVNQLLSRREFIRQGYMDKLELHLESSDWIPENVVNAMYRAYEGVGLGDALTVVWYSDIAADGIVLKPSWRVPVPIEPASPVQVAEETGVQETGITEAEATKAEATEAEVTEAEATGVEAAEAEVEELDAVDSEAGAATEPEEAAGQSAVEESMGITAGEFRERQVELINIVYGSTAYAEGRLGRNDNVLAKFMDYLALEGWEEWGEDIVFGEVEVEEAIVSAFETFNGATRSQSEGRRMSSDLLTGDRNEDKKIQTYLMWLRVVVSGQDRLHDTIDFELPMHPWNSVPHENRKLVLADARSKFNAAMRAATGKTKTIDWDDTTQGIVREDVIRTLEYVSEVFQQDMRIGLEDRVNLMSKISAFAWLVREIFTGKAFVGDYFNFGVREGLILDDIIKHAILLRGGSWV